MPHTPGYSEIPIHESLIGPIRLNAYMHIEFDADDPQQVAAAKGLAALHQAAPEMYALLKELELSKPNGPFFECPVCGGEVDDNTRTRGICVSAMGHEPKCRLAAVLKAVEGEGE